MPIGRQPFPCLNSLAPTDIAGGIAIQAAILAKRLYTNDFSGARPDRGKSGKRLGCRSFQKVKKPLRNPAVFAVNCNYQLQISCAPHNFLDFIVRRRT
jgi:hypothetical protein